MAGAITTSLVVQFGSDTDDSYTLSAEIDSRVEGFNKGNTSFLPGDSPYYLVYKSPELTLSTVQSTGNSVNSGTTDIDVVEYITFANSKTQNLSKPPVGSVTLTQLASVGTPGTLSRDGQTLYYAEPAIAVVKAEYTTRPSVYRMTGIPTTLGGETTFPVVVVITGVAA
jgi:hypothetical protein